MIIPPNETFMSGFERLLENTLSQIADNIDIIIFGGTTIEDDPMSELTFLYDYTKNKEHLDLAFVIANIIYKIKPKKYLPFWNCR